MSNDNKKKIEPWRMIIFIIAVAFILFMWIKKDIAKIYATMPQEQILPMIVTTIAVSLLKVGGLTVAILLIKWVVGKIVGKTDKTNVKKEKIQVKLFISAIAKFLLGVVLVGVLLFLPAGDFGYTNGWLLMGILFIPMFIAGIVMLFKNPDLLKKRLNAKEGQKEQNLVIKLSGLMFIAGFVVAGLGYRFSWYMLPWWAVIVGAVLFLIAYILYAEVLRENTYLSRTIEVQENQKVIDTGLYGIVRHPMYSVTLLLFLSMPIVLGSLYAFGIFLIYPILISVRIKKEEEFLEKELTGYIEYTQKVKYRLIPFIW
jgi:protein-S-isoprenylcysteine O-methyltransferase Ste14